MSTTPQDVRAAHDVDPPAIAPLVKELMLRCTVDRAWEALTRDVAQWWPVASHSVGGEAGTGLRLDGDGFVETLADGSETTWGEVLVWEPPRRLVMTWHPGQPSSPATEVEVTLAERGGESTLLRLEHRHWERIGPDVARGLAEYDDGWTYVLGQLPVRLGITQGAA
jgi:uncharacterized protein YndB with AHSA1/START domain